MSKKHPRTASPATAAPRKSRPIRANRAAKATAAPEAPAASTTTETAVKAALARDIPRLTGPASPDITLTPAPDQEELPPTETLAIRLDHLRAALVVAAKKDTRYYLNGVYLHAVANELRIVGSDGHRMLVISEVIAKVPEWLAAGVIIPRARLEGLVSYLSKKPADGEAAHEHCLVEFGMRHPRVIVKDAGGEASFRLQPVEGAYPDYQKLMGASGTAFANDARQPLDATMLNPDYMKAAGQIAGALGSEGIFPFLGDGKCAAVFTFAKVPGVVLYVMPITGDTPAIDTATARVIGKDGLKLSLAALKAHATRNRELAKKGKTKEERAKAEAAVLKYDNRIAELVASFKPALPAPVKAADAEAGEAKDGEVQAA